MEKIEKYNLPKTREERIKKLSDALQILKSEFVGLDDIIDKIGTSITPWYITPEVITRPTVISLWGMTGTGKTSVVRRLIDLLGIANKAIFFDCGEESNTGTRTVGDKISDISNVDDEDSVSTDKIKDYVFIFDEFQHARTINEHQEEVDKPNLRSVWNLLDNGILRFDEYSYEVNYFSNFMEDFREYVNEYPNVPIDDGKITDPNDVKNLLDILGYFYYDRGRPMMKGDEEEDKYDPINVLDDRIFRAIIRRVKSKNKSERTVNLIREIKGYKTTSELLEFLEEASKAVGAVREIDCNHSLIFILGNLDEAFQVEGEINPDIDADVFYDRTSKVTVNDIKNALKSRFRAEQIARFGNSIIKYPTLKKADFQKIIRMETSRVCREFEKTSGIKIKLDSSIYDLLYSEGVYPVQGVRPIFTTIGTILTPLFSDISINFKSGYEVTMEVKNPGEGYKVPQKTIIMKSLIRPAVERTVDLILGALRKPDSKKTRFINAVHETGHAIIMSWTTGKLPLSIVAISSDSGGFCVTYDPDKTGEIKCRRDVMNNVMISLGGYVAEERIFPNPELRLLGSASDIESAWEELSDAAYNCGYFEPFAYCNYETFRSSCPSGLDDSRDIKMDIQYELERAKTDVAEILDDNIDLLVDVALKLGETGEMSGDEFMEFIKRNDGTLTPERLKEALEENSTDYYKKMLEEKKEGN